MLPSKLQQGDEVRVIAPSRSLGIISEDQRLISSQRFQEMGLKVSFGKHVEEKDSFNSSAVESRVEDLHQAFADKNVKAILTAIGGFNSNQILQYLDYDLIKNNPKILCGYSDITALQNAIFAKTGLVTYSGPHFSTFAMKQRFDFTLEHFKKCLFAKESFELKPSSHWSDDAWYADQDKREFLPNPGYTVLNEGKGEGTIVGGNLCTFNLLQGTQYMPSLKNSLLWIEEDDSFAGYADAMFDRYVQSLIQQSDFSGVRGLIIGRFQKRSEMTVEKLRKIISTKKELLRIPVIYGVDFGHTDPYITFPVGGTARLQAENARVSLVVETH
ncbi:MAG TPA: S66 peptidase family protein [Bdellovibrio sp.]|nr:S66 peptidase family protein [Bdellovibrio sp.]